MHIVDLINQLDQDYPVGNEADLYRLRSTLALKLHSILLGYTLFVSAALVATLFALSWILPSTIVLALGLIAFIFIVAQISFCYQASIPEQEMTLGIQLDAQSSPELFSLINDVADKFEMSEISDVFVDQQLNAGAHTAGLRWLPFIKKRQILIGLLTLKLMTEDEVRAIVAHEMTHLKDSKLETQSWVIRAATAAWNATHAQFFNPVHRVINRGELKLRAVALLAAKRGEVEADRTAASIIGPERYGQALACILILGDIYRTLRPQDSSEFGLDRIPNLMGILEDELTKTIHQKESIIQIANKLESEIKATWEAHPTFKERLKSIEFDWSQNRQAILDRIHANKGGSLHLLGKISGEIIQSAKSKSERELSAVWEPSIEFRKLASGIDYSPFAKNRDCLRDMLWDRFFMAETFEKLSQVEQSLQRLKQEFPDCPYVQCMAANQELTKGNKDLIQTLETVLQGDNGGAASLAHELLLEHSQTLGLQASLTLAERYVELFEDRQRQLFHECKPRFIQDYRPAQFSEYRKQTLNLMFREAKISRAFAVHRPIQSYPGTKYFVFVIKGNQSAQGLNYLIHQLVPYIETWLASEHFFRFHIITGGALARRIIWKPGTEIFNIKHEA